MPTVSARSASGFARIFARAFWLALLLILLFSPVVQARDIVLGFVPEKCQLLTDVSHAELFAAYLSQGLERPVRVRVFTDERNLQQWMNRFREIDLAVFSRTYLQKYGKGRFLPLAEYVDSGTRKHGGGQVVARNGLSAAVFLHVKRRLFDAGKRSDAEALLAALRIENFVPIRQPQVGEGRFRRSAAASVRPVSAPPSLPPVFPPVAGSASAQNSKADFGLKLLSPPAGGKTGPQPLLLFETQARTVRASLDGRSIRSGAGYRLGPLADGNHELVFNSPDFIQPVKVSFQVDASPPALTADLPELPVSVSRLLLSGTRELDARIRLLDEQDREVATVDFPDRTHWQANLENLAEGVNRFQLEGRDAYGNRLRLPLVITRDSLAPELVIDSPLDGAAYRSPPELVFYAAGETSRILIDGQPSENPPEDMAALVDGEHLLEIRVLDSAGNTTSASIRFILDRQPPELTLEPFPDTLASSSSLLLQGQMDPDSRLSLSLDPDSVLAQLTYPQPGHWQLKLDNLVEGLNTVKVRSIDRAGNVSQQQAVLQVDLTPPQLQILSPAAGAIFRTSPSVEISSDAKKLRVQLDGRTLALDGEVVLPELAEGEHLLIVQAADAAGNLAEVSRSFLIDRSAPQLQLLSPRSGPTAESRPQFSYSGEARNILVTLDGKPLQVSNGDLLGPLSDGEHRLLLIATDSAGNRREIETIFSVDTRAPSWSLTQGRTGRTSDRILQGDLEAGSRIRFSSPTLIVGDVDYSSEGAWNVAVSGLQTGDNSLQVIVEDSAGNRTDDLVTLTLDDQAPVLRVDSPQEGFIYREEPPLEFSSDDGDIRLKLDAVPVEIAVGDRLPGLADGEHFLLLEATDAAGNEAVKAIRFQIDSQPPALNVDALPKATNQDNLRLSGQHEGGTGVLVATREGEPLCEIDPTADESWSCVIGPLPEGPLQLTVTATDRAGNQSVTALDTQIDRTPPQLEWRFPLPGTYAHIDRFDYLLNEGTLEISIDGQPFAVDQDPSGLSLVAGPHRIEVTARDAAGNMTRKTLTLTIDRQAPQVGIRSPGTLSNNPRPQLDFSLNDGQAEVYLDGMKLTVLNGEALPSLDDGEHLLRVEARDQAGNLGFAERRFLVDTSKPQLELDRDPGPLSSAAAILEGSVAANASLTAEFAGRDLQVDRPEPGRFLIHVSGLKEGANELLLRAVGDNGLFTEFPLQIVRDTHPVQLVLLSPEQRTYATSSPPLDYSTDSPPARLEIVVDGQPFELGSDKLLGPLTDGQHQLVLRAWDVAGNLAEQTTSFSVDTIAPDFLIQFDPRPISGSSLTLRGTRDVGAFVTLVAPPEVKVSTPRYPAENSWEIDLDGLPEGEVPLSLSARDQYGNTSRQQISLQIDRTPPQLEVSSPHPGAGNDPQPQLQVKGEGGALAILLNGQPVLAEVNQLGPLADGSYILLVREQDLAGNQSQQRVAFQVDTQAPEVTISSPASGARSSAHPILDYRVSDGSVHILLDDKPVRVESGTSLPQLTDGKHQLQVLAVDEAGNEGNATVEFFVDSSAPEVVLLSPPSGITADNTPLLDYEVDRGEVRVLVDGQIVGQRSGMSLAPLAQGEHLVRVEAWDENGNVGFAERRLVVSAARPDKVETEEIVDNFVDFSVSLTPEVVTPGYDGMLTLKVGPLRRTGATLYLEQWVDQNKNGVADSGEQIIRVFKLVDGLASPSPRVPGDTDAKADRMITTRLSLDQLHDGTPGPVQYVLLAMGDSNVGETVFRVIPEP